MGSFRRVTGEGLLNAYSCKSHVNVHFYAMHYLNPCSLGIFSPDSSMGKCLPMKCTFREINLVWEYAQILQLWCTLIQTWRKRMFLFFLFGNDVAIYPCGYIELSCVTRSINKSINMRYEEVLSVWKKLNFYYSLLKEKTKNLFNHNYYYH